MTFEDITSVDTMRPWDELFRQREQAIHERNEAIAEAEVLKLELKDITEQRDALARRAAELGLANGRLRSRLIEAGLTP